MATNNRVFYEVNPRFFKDTTGNGIGDLQGLIQKIDYFSFLGINTIILQDVLLIESKEKSLKYFVKEVNPQIGNNKLLHEFILLAQKKKIKVLLELPWLKSIQKDPQNFLKKKLHLVLPDFSEFISYWNNYNVGGFVITNFENIEKKWFQKTIDNSIISTLHDFYHKSKEVDSELLIIGRSSKLKIIHAKKHVEGTNQIFDYFLSENLTINSISKEHGIHIWNKLNLNILVKNLKQIACQPNFIVAFDTKHFGRVISRWIDNENYWAEAAKSLVMLLMIGKASPLIYYGNEIGLTNIGLKSLNDFPNIHLVKKEKAFKELSITDEELLKAYKFQHPINANPLMAWNSSTNGGFSQGPKMIVPSSSNFKEINVLNQFHDSFSVLNFSKEIIIISNILKNTPLFQKGIYKITLVMKNVIKITWKLNDKKLVAFFNFSNKNKELKWNSFSKKHIIISNCTAERKEDVVSKLRPFETIIFKNFANSTLDSIRKKDLNKHKNIFNHSESTKNNSKFQKNISPKLVESIEKQAQKQIEAKRKNLEKQKLEEEYSKKIEEAKRSQVEQVKREMTKDTNNASSSKNFENKIANGPKPKVFSHTSEINIVKKEAQTLQKVEKSYLDEKTQLKEEEVAKTTLIDEDFDLSDLFVEKDDS